MLQLAGSFFLRSCLSGRFLFAASRIVFLFGGGLMMAPDTTNAGPEKCYSVNLFRPLVYAEAPCEQQH